MYRKYNACQFSNTTSGKLSFTVCSNDQRVHRLTSSIITKHFKYTNVTFITYLCPLVYLIISIGKAIYWWNLMFRTVSECCNCLSNNKYFYSFKFAFSLHPVLDSCMTMLFSRILVELFCQDKVHSVIQTVLYQAYNRVNGHFKTFLVSSGSSASFFSFSLLWNFHFYSQHCLSILWKSQESLHVSYFEMNDLVVFSVFWHCLVAFAIRLDFNIIFNLFICMNIKNASNHSSVFDEFLGLDWITGLWLLALTIKNTWRALRLELGAF